MAWFQRAGAGTAWVCGCRRCRSLLPCPRCGRRGDGLCPWSLVGRGAKVGVSRGRLIWLFVGILHPGMRRALVLCRSVSPIIVSFRVFRVWRITRWDSAVVVCGTTGDRVSPISVSFGLFWVCRITEGDSAFMPCRVCWTASVSPSSHLAFLRSGGSQDGTRLGAVRGDVRPSKSHRRLIRCFSGLTDHRVGLDLAQRVMGRDDESHVCLISPFSGILSAPGMRRIAIAWPVCIGREPERPGGTTAAGSGRECRAGRSRSRRH